MPVRYMESSQSIPMSASTVRGAPFAILIGAMRPSCASCLLLLLLLGQEPPPLYLCLLYYWSLSCRTTIK
jgi:hypothetical protein